MRSAFKLLSVISLCVAYIVIAGVVYLDFFPLQLLLVAVMSVLFMLRKGLKALFGVFRVLVPLVLTLMFVYMLFSWLDFKPSGYRGSSADYWLGYGSVRALILISTILFFRLCGSFLTGRDILSLSVSMHVKKHYILGVTLYRTAFSHQGRLREQIGLIPSSRFTRKGISGLFRTNMNYLLAMLYLIINESTAVGELIDNRIACCHEEEK